ncbi:MAG: hypothetical protein ACRC2T_06435 [Thermoguttaceae bacterium]
MNQTLKLAMVAALDGLAPADAVKNEMFARGFGTEKRETEHGVFTRVGGEFYCVRYKPKLTLDIKSVTFNAACVRLLPDWQHVSISFCDKELRIIV